MNDVADPLDYEDFLSQYQLLIDRDPLRTMLDFPQNYLEVQIIKRPIRTLQPIMPEENMSVTPNILNTVTFNTRFVLSGTLFRLTSRCASTATRLTGTW